MDYLMGLVTVLCIVILVLLKKVSTDIAGISERLRAIEVDLDGEPPEPDEGEP